ncbi:hypothetical protein LUW77_02210 [Streptomyces radiopugnans]|nr:hypothetical protein LUW77_02210 [Streptomyces radiopugnans]
MLFLLVPGEGILTYLSVVVVSALANAALVNWCVRTLGRGGRSTGDAG